MFHLLVSYRGWPDSGGSLSNSRIYLRQDEDLGRHFYTNGKLDISKVGQIPALLVTETGGDGPQYARVAHITRLTRGSSETSIQYTLDSGMPTISNEDLEGLSTELGLGRYALTHTHWGICEVDLFRILLLHQMKSGIAPKVFSIEEMGHQDAGLMSVMMPFKAEFNPIYATLQASAVATGLTCVRADDIWEHHAVIQDIVNIISRAKVVVCDCSGKNPNVFYEAGIAHTLGKEVILITRSEEDIPFDLRHLRYIKYLPNNEGLNNLSQAIQARLKSVIGYR